MALPNPPQPGEFIRDVYMQPFGITGQTLAGKLGVSPSTLNRVLKGTSGINSEMALRLSKTRGRSPGSWRALQDQYELWQARRTIDLDTVEKSSSTRLEPS